MPSRQPVASTGRTRRKLQLGIVLLFLANYFCDAYVRESRFALIQAWNLQATLEMQWFRLDRFSRVFYGIYSCDELLSVCRYDEVNKTTIADPELTPDPIVFEMGVISQKLNLGVFPRYFIGLTEYDAKPLSFGPLNMLPCDDICFKSFPPRVDTDANDPFDTHAFYWSSTSKYLSLTLRFRAYRTRCTQYGHYQDNKFNSYTKLEFVTNNYDRGYARAEGNWYYKLVFKHFDEQRLFIIKVLFGFTCPGYPERSYYRKFNFSVSKK
ncbi:uncharacterized protein LOC111253485 isoform X1 [Varroa destructor]|uniref:Uncharacterized protein n=2 Tax=Varroa destructor TaxID=109461 RepID=A0A7M7KLG3_VARDE|nr:uncharacterized protein LOC111253485 isoform X1 [Varroa destructor]